MNKGGLILKTSLLAVLLFSFYALPAYALTVQEVARDLACPCECPLVLEDCNMSCGLDWKNQIGEKIIEGESKEEIVGGFIKKYGDACRITPMQRVHGKFYQYTRAFDTLEWFIFWSVIVLWVLALFLAMYLLVRKLTRKKPKENENG